MDKGIDSPKWDRIKQDAKESKRIEEYLRQEKKKFIQFQKEPKLLILGSSDSGKSTLLKQLKIIQGNGFSENEIMESKHRIWNNVCQACGQLTSKEAFQIVYVN
jgi:guanine nucleotide-binding protein G(i) subunit alpha